MSSAVFSISLSSFWVPVLTSTFPTRSDGNTYLLFDHYVDEWGPKPEYKRQCQTPLYATQLYINCNSFHELDRTTVHRHNENSDFPQVVGNGESHYVFKILPPQAPQHPFVLKTIFTDTRPDTSYSHRQYEEMRKDAIVFDLFQNNNYFVDMYGYCGLSIFSEFMPHGDIDTVATPTFDAYRTNNNNWTDDQLLHMNSMEPEFKLRVALEMAESVAYLHNFEGGIIVHNDLHAVQFLFTPEGRNHWNTTNQVLKISDFNMATFMKYDMNDHEYCTYHNGIGGGDVSFVLVYIFTPEPYVWLLSHTYSDVVAFARRVSRSAVGRKD